MHAVDKPRTAGRAVPAIEAVRGRVDEELRRFLDAQRAGLERTHPDGAILVEEIARLVIAGGKRVRPAFCYWGHRAAGGVEGEPIIRAAASLELLHVFALVHDDVMDRSETRRGVASTHARFRDAATDSAMSGDAAAIRGVSMAILVGDLAAVLADQLFLASGFAPEVLAGAARIGLSARVDMAIGQLLDITRSGADEELAALVARTKTGGYTIAAPLAIGATLAGGSPDVFDVLAAYAAPLGEAFQIRDDLAALDETGESLAGPTLLMARASARRSPKGSSGTRAGESRRAGGGARIERRGRRGASAGRRARPPGRRCLWTMPRCRTRPRRPSGSWPGR